MISLAPDDEPGELHRRRADHRRSFSEAEAQNLARVLKSGALPVQLADPEPSQNVSPTLGKDSLRAASSPASSASLLVLLFMIVLLPHARRRRRRRRRRLRCADLERDLVALARPPASRCRCRASPASSCPSASPSTRYVVFFERLKDEVRAGRTHAQRRPARLHRRVAHDRGRRPRVADRRVRAVVPDGRLGAQLRVLPRALHAAATCSSRTSSPARSVLLLARTKWMAQAQGDGHRGDATRRWRR